MEIWKDVKGYEGLYAVSNYGNVKSFIKNKKGNLLKAHLNNPGYLFVNLYKNKLVKNKMIHQMIYESFYNVKSSKKNVIDHIDNNKLNNNISNLQLISSRLNSCKDKQSKTGYSNIYFNSGAYLVRMRINDIKYSIGTKSNIDEAILIRDNFILNVLPLIEQNKYSKNQIKNIISAHKLQQ